MELISIIVPVYKVEKYIHRCVDSIINQTYKNIEIILVDDGSPDNCGRICDEYAAKDSRIKVIHKPNGGLSDARNCGIEAADGEWLMFIDSDDWIHTQTVEVLYNAAIKNGVNVSVCNFTETQGEQPVIDGEFESEKYTPKDFYTAYHVVATIACAKLYKRSCFKNIRYPKGKIHEDEYVTYRILFDEDNVAFVNQPYYAYYINPESITKSSWSPKRLDAVEAVSDQLRFFKRTNDQELIDFALSRYFWCLHRQESLCDKKIYKKEHRFIKRKLNTIVFLNLGYFFDIRNAYMLEIMHPVFMKYYWLARAAVRKILRRK